MYLLERLWVELIPIPGELLVPTPSKYISVKQSKSTYINISNLFHNQIKERVKKEKNEADNRITIRVVENENDYQMTGLNGSA